MHKWPHFQMHIKKKLHVTIFAKQVFSKQKLAPYFFAGNNTSRPPFTSYMKISCKPHYEIIEEMEKGEGINARSEAIWNGVTGVTFSKLWMATVVTLLSTPNKRSHKYERPYTPRLLGWINLMFGGNKKHHDMRKLLWHFLEIPGNSYLILDQNAGCYNVFEYN